MSEIDTSAEAIGRSITELMSWLTGPDGGQNDGLVTAANQLAALAAERDGKAQEACQALDMWKKAAAERDAARAEAARLVALLRRIEEAATDTPTPDDAERALTAIYEWCVAALAQKEPRDD